MIKTISHNLVGALKRPSSRVMKNAKEVTLVLPANLILVPTESGLVFRFMTQATLSARINENL